jgi:uncharacterized protein YprB with RNaseH-like and TPR domain
MWVEFCVIDLASGKTIAQISIDKEEDTNGVSAIHAMYLWRQAQIEALLHGHGI